MKNHRDMFKSKMLCCYDIDGNPNWDYIEFLHKLNEWFLGNRPDYLGLAPYGSQAKGYALKSSDYDVLLFAGNGDREDNWELQNRINAIARPFRKEGNSPHIRGYNCFGGNFTIHSPEHPVTSYSDPLNFLLYPFIGDMEKMDKICEMARQKHRFHLEHHPDNARRNVESVVCSQLIHELSVHVQKDESVCKQLLEGRTSKKMMDRGYTLENLESIVEARKTLWFNRCNVFLAERKVEESLLC